MIRGRAETRFFPTLTPKYDSQHSDAVQLVYLQLRGMSFDHAVYITKGTHEGQGDARADAVRQRARKKISISVARVD